jgi:hypothetical protein
VNAPAHPARSRWFFVCLLTAAAGGGIACLLWPDDAQVGAGTEGGSQASAEAPQRPDFVPLPADEAVPDGGVGRVAGLVLDPEGRPAPGAKVRLLAGAPEVELLECGECHEHVLDCGWYQTAARVMEAIRSGAFAPRAPLAETVTDDTGHFAFEQAPLDGTVVARLDALQGEAPSDGEQVELMLSVPRHSALIVLDETSKPMPGVRVAAYSPLDGALVERTTNAEGRVEFDLCDSRAWLYVEHPGMLPVGLRAVSSDTIFLAPPKTLVVRTRLGGQPIDADVSLTLHGEKPRVLRARGGVLRVEQLPLGGVYTVSAKAGEFASAELGVELFEANTELTLELRRTGRVMLTVVSETGEPFAQAVDASLSGADSTVTATAEQGAMLVLGPAPEGEYWLNVSSPGLVSVERVVDVRPGELSVEVVLRPALHVRGTVVDGAGRLVAGARVSGAQGGADQASVFTDERGGFDLEFRVGGPVQLTAGRGDLGEGHVEARAPGAEIVVTLLERAALEVTLTDVDGATVHDSLMVRGKTDGVVRWLEAREGDRSSRLAGLPGGRYVLEHDAPGRVLLEHEVELVEGRTTRLSLRREAGVTASGRVVDHEGKPVEGATVLSPRQRNPATTGADGRFSLAGLQPGPATLFATDPRGSSSPRLDVTVPATELELRIPAAPRVKGRVVDESGRPLTAFSINGEELQPPDGRFEVAMPAVLDLVAPGRESVYVDEPKDDLGDVVLRLEQAIEGVVLDGEGRPVAGATVVAALGTATGVTDARGRFKLQSAGVDSIDLIATRGSQAGTTRALPGQRDVRITLEKGAIVAGLVLDSTGKGARTLVSARHSTLQRPVEVETDDGGRFTLELPRGIWALSTRLNSVARNVDARGPRVEVVLGEEPASCDVTLRARTRIDHVWLFAGGAADGAPWHEMATNPSALEVSIPSPAEQVSLRGLPCGRFTLAASLGEHVSAQQVDLTGHGQVLELREQGPAEAPVAP